MSSIHFISDLHLQPARPAMTSILLHYLETRAHEAEALYILGDLFEFWIGDDISIPENAPVIDALRRFSNTGTALYFMHGNRDFLVGDAFARDTGSVLLADPTVIDLFGVPTLLMHGDTLCIDDTAYQAMRAQVRDPDNQRQFLALPGEQRRQIATALRGGSGKVDKADDIMDVNEDAVRRCMDGHRVPRLIHGHTHRPDRHSVSLDGNDGERIVLADWHDDRGSVVVADADGCRFEPLYAPA